MLVMRRGWSRESCKTLRARHGSVFRNLPAGCQTSPMPIVVQARSAPTGGTGIQSSVDARRKEPDLVVFRFGALRERSTPR
jgi:hypothetical protein